MKVIQCQKCSKVYPNTLKNCPECMYPTPKKPIYKKWWFWLIIVFVIMMIAVGSSGGDSEDVSNSSSSTTTTSSETITYEKVDLQTMLDELDTNALRAEKTYQNKYIEITGKIDNIDSDGSYISILPTTASDWSFDNVQCYIKNDEQLDFISNKNVGDKITIKGKVTSIGEILGYSIDIKSITDAK